MEHFNELAPAEAELLALLAEECGECIQAIAKVLRHGYYSANPLLESGPQNYASLEKEMGDVRAAMILLCNSDSPVTKKAVHFNAEIKLENVGRWLHHQAPNAKVRGPL